MPSKRQTCLKGYFGINNRHFLKDFGAIPKGIALFLYPLGQSIRNKSPCNSRYTGYGMGWFLPDTSIFFPFFKILLLIFIPIIAAEISKLTGVSQVCCIKIRGYYGRYIHSVIPGIILMYAAYGHTRLSFTLRFGAFLLNLLKI